MISVNKSVKKPIGVLLELFMKPKIARRVGPGLRTFVGFLRWLKCTRCIWWPISRIFGWILLINCDKWLNVVKYNHIWLWCQSGHYGCDDVPYIGEVLMPRPPPAGILKLTSLERLWNWHLLPTPRPSIPEINQQERWCTSKPFLGVFLCWAVCDIKNKST